MNMININVLFKENIEYTFDNLINYSREDAYGHDSSSYL